MNAPDLSPLVKGSLALIGIALTLGQFGKLETWARHQAVEAVAWKQPLPYFFASKPRDTKKHHPHPKTIIHQ
jgi:hypothetical protein